MFNLLNICWVSDISSMGRNNFKKDKYNDFLKIQIYCISFYYNYRNYEQIILN